MIRDDWRPHQIFYLEQERTRLYAELIQFVAARNLCWLRPIALCCPSEPNAVNATETAVALYDLRQGADLICPAALLHLALDTEVLPIWAQLHGLKPELAAAQNADRLRQFMRQLWQAEPEAFQP